MRSFRFLAVLLGLAITVSPLCAADSGVTRGTVDLKSAGPLAFGPNGVLFVADPAAATIYAVESGDTAGNGGPVTYKQGKIDDKLASMLGMPAGDVGIADMVVNPNSGQVYFSVRRGQGPQATPVIMRLNRQSEFSEFPLKDVKYSKATLPDPAPTAPPPPAATGGRQRPRPPAITGLAFISGKLYVAAMSNEQFDSTFRAIAYPFSNVDKGTTVEIYHGNHGKLETRSPIRSFTAFEITGQEHLLAAYTCTPLVKIPLSDIKPGAKVKGTTIAELGNQNTPLDMVVYNKGGKDYLLMINDNRGVMKIDLEKIGSIQPIEERVGGIAGLPYQTIDAMKGVVQMSKLDAGHALVLVKGADGKHNLETVDLP